MSGAVSSLKKFVKDAKQQVAAEDKAATTAVKVGVDEVLVRLIRPLFLASGALVPAGIHKLKKELVPNSAIVLKDGGSEGQAPTKVEEPEDDE